MANGNGKHLTLKSYIPLPCSHTMSIYSRHSKKQKVLKRSTGTLKSLRMECGPFRMHTVGDSSGSQTHEEERGFCRSLLDGITRLPGSDEAQDATQARSGITRRTIKRMQQCNLTTADIGNHLTKPFIFRQYMQWRLHVLDTASLAIATDRDVVGTENTHLLEQRRMNTKSWIVGDPDHTAPLPVTQRTLSVESESLRSNSQDYRYPLLISDKRVV